jgi:hypothetical protein
MKIEGGKAMQNDRPNKLFTIEEANQMLPLVRAITSDLVQLANELVERRQRLAMLTAGRDREAGNPYSDELVAIEAEIEKDAQRLRGYIEELVQLGVEPKSAMDGLVDFPSMMDGRVVYLCWKLGEPEILHWHEIDAGFAGRQSIAAGVL